MRIVAKCRLESQQRYIGAMLGPRFFEPARTVFWESIHDIQPDLYKSFNPWDRISEVDAVLGLLSGAGLRDAEQLLSLTLRRPTSPATGGQ